MRKSHLFTLLLMLSIGPCSAAASTQVQQAVAYWQDQDAERAFRTFLLALDAAPFATPISMSVEETPLYADALALYLTHSGRDAIAAAEQIYDRYAKIIAEHPDYYHLGYLVALSAANRGQFDIFFEQFYPCYCADRTHFLADKTCALLHHRLMERAREPLQRNHERKLALQSIQSALQRFSGDPSLYSMSLTLASPSEKSGLVQSALGKITRDSVVVPRHDILFYVKEAVGTQEWQLAEQFLAKAHQWYPSSRIVEQAGCYLRERRAEIDKEG